MSKKVSVIVDEQTFVDLSDAAATMDLSTSEMARQAISVGLWMVGRLNEGHLMFQPRDSDELRRVEIVQP